MNYPTFSHSPHDLDPRKHFFPWASPPDHFQFVFPPNIPHSSPLTQIRAPYIMHSRTDKETRFLDAVDPIIPAEQSITRPRLPWIPVGCLPRRPGGRLDPPSPSRWGWARRNGGTTSLEQKAGASRWRNSNLRFWNWGHKLQSLQPELPE